MLGAPMAIRLSQLASAKGDPQFVGLDYLPEMIEQARASMQSLPSSIPGEVDFDVGQPSWPNT